MRFESLKNFQKKYIYIDRVLKNFFGKQLLKIYIIYTPRSLVHEKKKNSSFAGTNGVLVERNTSCPIHKEDEKKYIIHMSSNIKPRAVRNQIQAKREYDLFT